MSRGTNKAIKLYVFRKNIFFFFIEFIGVTLVNKIIQVLGVQFYSTSPVYYIVFTTQSQVPFHHHLSSSSSSHPCFPSGNRHTVVVCVSLLSIYLFIFHNSTFSPSPPTSLPSDHCQSVLCIQACCIAFGHRTGFLRNFETLKGAVSPTGFV